MLTIMSNQDFISFFAPLANKMQSYPCYKIAIKFICNREGVKLPDDRILKHMYTNFCGYTGNDFEYEWLKHS